MLQHPGCARHLPGHAPGGVSLLSLPEVGVIPMAIRAVPQGEVGSVT